MSPTIALDTILTATPWCVVREQEDQYLVYNSQTDELHLLPPTGYYAYRLCDGCSTLREIEQDLAAKIPGDDAAVRDGLREFLAKLVVRGILEAAT